MRRFVLFAGDDYYPRGGAMDFWASYSTREEAKRAFETGGEDEGLLADWGIVAEWNGERFVGIEENTVWMEAGRSVRKWEAA